MLVLSCELSHLTEVVLWTNIMNVLSVAIIELVCLDDVAGEDDFLRGVGVGTK